MRKVAIFVGVAICVATARFPAGPLFLAGHAGSAIGLMLAAGLFTIAIAAVVRK